MYIPSRVFTLALILWLCTGCSDTWEGFVYPNATISPSIETSALSLLSQHAALLRRVMLASLHALEQGDYECGKNCNGGSQLGGIKVCKETLR